MYVYILSELVQISDGKMPRLMDVYEELEGAINALPAPSGNIIKRFETTWKTVDDQYVIERYRVRGTQPCGSLF